MFKKKNHEVKPLNIFIVGGGKVGTTLIESLVKEGNNITLVDINESRIRDIGAQFDIMTCVGNGASYRVLVDSGIQEADVFIAVTASDELNLLCCSVAGQVSNANTIARVRTPDYSAEVWYLRDKLGLTMVINPELESATEISRILNVPAALEVNLFARGEAQMVKLKVNEGDFLCGKSLPEVVSDLPVRMLFTAGERNGDTFIPNGSYVFQAGDTISYVTGRKNTIPSMRAIGLYHNPLKNCLIIGGGKGAYYLAMHLISAGLDVKIIEQNHKRCEELSATLPKATIIEADGADIEILKEEGIEYYDAVVPFTGIDEVNVMLTLYAKKVTKAKVVTKIGRYTFNDVIEDLDLGSIVFPRRITSDIILAYTRAKRVAGEGEIETLYHMFDGRVEAIEFVVNKKMEITGIPLSELELDNNVLIAFLFRNGKIIFPKGDDCIEVGDSVMVVTTNLGYQNIQDILR